MVERPIQTVLYITKTRKNAWNVWKFLSDPNSMVKSRDSRDTFQTREPKTLRICHAPLR